MDVIIHPEYNKPSRFQNDIAIVKLDRDIEINGDHLTYCLVPQIDPSVPQPVVQSRRRPLLEPSPG